MSETARRFRWAILGTGGVSRKFVLDLKHAGAEAHVVASRRPENAEAFARSLNVAEAAPDYAAAVAADVDAVYVATPPALHETHALMALEAGKPVLIEKPFALDGAAARRIAEAAEARGLFCMEALWTRFQPLIETASDRIAAGDLGALRSFEGSFCAANIPDPSSSLFDPAQGGGALMHRGIYPLSLARRLMGPVADMTATARLGETGVDEDCVLVLRHESGALSTIRASLRAQGRDGTVIAGTKGTLVLEGPAYRPTGGHIQPTAPAVAATGQAGPRRFEAFRESASGLAASRHLSALKLMRRRQRLASSLVGNGYNYEARAVAEAVAAGRRQADQMTCAESVEIMDLIDAARQQWGVTS